MPVQLNKATITKRVPKHHFLLKGKVASHPHWKAGVTAHSMVERQTLMQCFQPY